MTNTDPMIKALDIAAAALQTYAETMQMINNARAEGRTVTIEELQAMRAESKKLEDAWHNAGK